MCAHIYNYLKIKLFILVVLRASVHFLVKKFLIQTPFPTSSGVTRSLKMSGSEADGSEKNQSEALRLSQTSWSVWPQISLFSFLFSRQLIRLTMGNFLTTSKASRQNSFESLDIMQNQPWPQDCFHPPTGSLAMSMRQYANMNFSISFLFCLFVPNQCLGGVNSVECLNPMTKHSCRFSRAFGALSTSKWHLDDTQCICACFKLKKSFRNLSQLFASNLSFNYPYHFIFFRSASRICLYFQHLRSQYTNCPQVSNSKYSNTIQRDPCDEQLLEREELPGKNCREGLIVGTNIQKFTCFNSRALFWPPFQWTGEFQVRFWSVQAYLNDN